jgi:hypothetical protein
MNWIKEIIRKALPPYIDECSCPREGDPRGGKFQVYDGPLDGKLIKYTGEVFRVDDKGPCAADPSTHEYILKCDYYSHRLYYVWTLASLDPYLRHSVGYRD